LLVLEKGPERLAREVDVLPALLSDLLDLWKASR